MSFRSPGLPQSLAEGAVEILGAPEPADKVALSRALASAWRKGGLPVGEAVAPTRPARPERPLLSPPRDMPKRRNFGSPAGCIALLHALAHIELNAIDLAWDIVALCRCRHTARVLRRLDPCRGRGSRTLCLACRSACGARRRLW